MVIDVPLPPRENYTQRVIFKQPSLAIKDKEETVEGLENSMTLDPPFELARQQSEISMISESSPLHYILDTGRFKKKFKNITLIGKGGFGRVYKATNYVDRKDYAIKVIRLHIKKSSSVEEIYNHRVYREL
jgi:hypothetical protein